MPAVEGPPDPREIESVARDLILRGQLRDAEALADVMIEWWQPIEGPHAERRFMWWLGFSSAAGLAARVIDR